VGTKAVEIVHDGGLVERAVPECRASRACLEDTDITKLWDLATLVGERIGERRDLEWAIEGGRLYVLQDRPITGLPPREPKVVWSRRFGDEYLAEYVSQLGHDLMIPWLVGPQIDEVAELQGRPEIVEIQKFLRHDGHMYLNGDYAMALAAGVPVEARGTLANWFDPIFLRRLEEVPFRSGLLVKTLRAPAKDPGRGKAKDNLTALERHCARIEEVLVPHLRQDFAALDVREWRRQLALVDELGRDHFRVIRWGMAHHAPLLQGALVKLLTRWVAEDPESLLQTLLSGLSGTMTAAINRDVWDLAITARRDPVLFEALRSEDGYDEVRRATASADFWSQFDAFLLQHGHRSSSREIAAERWLERPDVVLGLIRAQVRVDVAGSSPMEFEERSRARRVELEEELRRKIGRGPLGRLRLRIFDLILGRLQMFTIYRENQRYHLDYLLCHLHLLVLEQGRRLVDDGVLGEPSDAFVLTLERFVSLVEADAAGRAVVREEVRAEVAAGRAHRERHTSRVPAAFLFDGVPTEGFVEPPGEAAEGLLVGFGASAGVSTGPVRVVRGLGDLARVQTGDVLVASNIDPGWTSVFPLLAGLVTETGGVLSHGAILAREYGLPTVTSVDGALPHLETGDLVTVDGTAGTVASRPGSTSDNQIAGEAMTPVRSGR
jgi:pyruvate,water dikinase